MIDGIRASRAERAIFRHNDLEHLRELLEALPAEQPRIVAFESIYSMDGDIAPLREICALAAEYGAITYLDETHAAGAYGHEGAGVAQAVGAAGRGHDRAGQPGQGLRDARRLHRRARPAWSTACAATPAASSSRPRCRPAIAAAALASVRHLRASAAERAALWRSVARCERPSPAPASSRMPSESHIVPVLVPGAERCREVARRLLDGALDLRAADQLPVGPARSRAPAHRPHARARPGPRRGARARARHAAAVRVSLNHVALSATDIERSTRFYEQLFGCERLPVPDVGFPTVWLSLGDRQLHLFERDTAVPPLHHFAVAVDDFAEACRRAEATRRLRGRSLRPRGLSPARRHGAALPARSRRASRRGRRRTRRGRGRRRPHRAALGAAPPGRRARAGHAVRDRHPLQERRGAGMTPAAYAVGLARHAADGRLLDAWFPRTNVGEHPQSGAKILAAAGLESGSADAGRRGRRAPARDDPRHQRRHDPQPAPRGRCTQRSFRAADRDRHRVAR